MYFEDRIDAGRRLAERIKPMSLRDPVVLGLPRGGMVVASEVAKIFSLKPDLLIVRKIGAPFNPELAMGAIVEGDPQTIFLNQDLISVLKVSKEFLDSEKQRQQAEIERQQKLFRQGRQRTSVKDRIVILVDDGIATGATVHAALKALRAEKPAQLILAIPVASPDALEGLRGDAHEIICLTSPKDFQAVGQFFRHFFEVSEDEVLHLIS